jgi:hypothetical protein
MSSSVNVFVVELDKLRRAIGSHDRQLIEAIQEDQERFLASIDDIDDEAELKCAQAVEHLIAGNPSDDCPGYLYGYAVEAICRQLGHELPNICPIAGATDWLAEVDAALKIHQVPLQLSALVFGKCPVEIPQPDDCPCIGVWSPQSIPPALAALQGIELLGLEREMTETFQDIRGWLTEAAKTPGEAIVGFLS